MRSLLAGFMLLGLLSVGCKKEDTPPAAPAQAPADSATQAAGQPVNEPAPPDAGPAETPDAATAAPAAQLPAPRWETLPGWLGVCAVGGAMALAGLVALGLAGSRRPAG